MPRQLPHQADAPSLNPVLLLREHRRHEPFALSRVKGKLPPSSNSVEGATLLPSCARFGKEKEILVNSASCVH
jgi:hypothetical protein